MIHISRKYFIQFLLLLLVFVSTGIRAQNKSPRFYSHTPDGIMDFKISLDKILIRFRTDITVEEQITLFNQFSIFKPFSKEMNLPSPQVTIAEVLPGQTEKDVLNAINQLRSLNDVVYANPFLLYADGTLQGIQNRFAVKLKSSSDYGKLVTLAKTHGASIVEKNEYDPLVYFVEVNKSSSGNALELANQFAESNQFQYAEPDFLKILQRFNTNDTFLNYQWSLNNTGSSIQYNGTAGADMNVFSAWGISTGNATTKIAIIDEGVDLVHPDLVGNMLSGYDGTLQGSGGAPQGNDAHGTACAGIVAASGNNNLGIAGVAYNSKIVPVRIAYSSGGNWITSDAWIGASIDWAWNQGDADVLSNSWGGGSSSSLINDPIGRAVTQGRGGLGSLVLFAAGNSNGAVFYPATLTNVISVAAMSMCNERKNPASCDGENFWGSNYGTNVDIAAPGVKIYTTDISGGSGYSGGDYTATFNGTSSATPNAAGVAALILATNPALTQAEARQIIESTCVKTGGYTYNANVAGQPNGTWSDDLGYGRVNAFAALQLANPVACTNPPAVALSNANPSTFCTSPTSISLSLSGITFGTGQTYQWQSSPDNSTWTNIGGATLQIYTASVSANTWFRCLVTCTATTPSTAIQVTYSDPTVTTFPHDQNFDGSGGLPCGWTVQNVNSDANTWVNSTNNPRSAPNAVMYTYNTSAAADDWLFTTPLAMTAGTNYQVTFWYRAQSATYPEGLEVKWGNSATATGMTSAALFNNTAITNTTYAQGTGSVFTPPSTGIYYIGFHVISAADMWLLMLDDVTITATATCAIPNVGGTASGPGIMTVGTSGTFNLVGFTGTTINWQQSTNGGSSYSDISGATTASSSINLAQGSNLMRARVSSAGCIDAYSNILSVTVNPRPGDNLSIAILVTTPFTTTLSTTAGSGFTNQYTGTNAQVSPDVFFVLTTGPCTDSLRITTCAGTNFDSYIHLLTSAGTNIASVDDNGPYCATTRASMRALVTPNTTYYVVVEGFNTSTGTFQLDITQIDNPVFAATVTPSGATTFCSGGSVTLTSSAGTAYAWSNGATSQQINVSASGVYSVVTTNASGCNATSNAVTVTVNSLPVAVITPSGPTTFCAGGSVTLTASGGSSYNWSTGATSAAINATSSNTYTVTVTNTNNCQAQSSQAVTVNPSVVPAVSINLTGGANPACAGSSITFTATPINGGTTPSYQWKINGANAGTNSSTFTTTSLTNGQNVTCEMTSNASCASPSLAISNSIAMTINPVLTPSVSIALTAGSNPSCAGSSLTFTATPINGGTTPSYQWKINGANAGTNSPSFTTTSLTNGQIITCEMTSNASCASPSLATSNSITVTINTVLTPSVSIALTAGSNPSCAGSSLTFAATPTNGGASPSYQWKINGVNAGTNSSTFNTTSLTNGQIVTCELTSNASCASPSLATSNSITMTINLVLTPSVIIALTAGSNPSCAGSSITFTATPTNGGASPSYQWKINGANAGTNSPTFTTTSLTNGQIVTCEMTSNASCASPSLATSNSIMVTINTVLTPSVSIALTAGSNPSCAGSSITFTATPTNGGTTPSYQWKINGANAGTNSPTFTTTSLTNGQIVTCEMTSNASCASPSLATSNSITVTINTVLTPSVSIALTAGSNPSCAGSSITFTATPTNGGTSPSYQWKINGANAGTNSPTFTTTSLTDGQIVTCEMTSNAVCLSTSTATSNALTISITNSVIWYADADNDGFGNALSSTTACTQPVGFVNVAGDCNDGNASVNPAATEICSNGIDEDCDGIADDGCPSVPNDLRPNAISLVVGAYNICNSTTGTITLATTSPESQSTAITGQDLWYSFTAMSPGVQIRLTTTSFNALVELQNSSGVMIDSENLQSTVGNEHLNIGNLTPGQLYFVAVRNFNSAQGTGNFSICISNLPSSGCLTPAPAYTMCSNFKAIVVNATNYVYNFTSTQTNITYSRTQSSAILDLYKVMSMPTGSNYNARVDAQYTVTRGNGTTEVITVQAPTTCTIAFNADPLLILATTQDCPSPRPLGVNIRSNTTVCFASNYQWEFQKADLSAPVFTFNGGSTQYLMITSAMGFVPGTTYNVRIRVTYQNGFTNPWGPVSCLLIAGTAGMDEFENNDPLHYAFDRTDSQMEVNLYPNPGNGDLINLEIAGIESGLVDVYLTDVMGKRIATKQYYVEGYLLTQWVFDADLSFGLYLIDVVYDGKKVSQRIIVE